MVNKSATSVAFGRSTAMTPILLTPSRRRAGKPRYWVEYSDGRISFVFQTTTTPGKTLVGAPEFLSLRAGARRRPSAAVQKPLPEAEFSQLT